MQNLGAISGAFVAGAAALALYTVTLAPTVGGVDSGELIAAASELGVAHPPGFPLYMLLTHPITRIPLGSVAVRANFASALFAAFAIATMFLLVHALITRAAQRAAAVAVSNARSRKSRRDAERGQGEHTPVRARVRIFGALTAALLFASFGTTWAYATVAEVYTLAAWLVLLVWLLVARGRLHVAAFVFGAGMGVHPAISVAMLPALAVLAYRTRGPALVTNRQFAIATLVAASGLTVYLYLPVAALQSPALNWGDPRTFDRFWAHVSGWQYRATSEFSLSAFADSATRFGTIFWQQFGKGMAPVGLILAALGAQDSFRVDRTLFWTAVTWMVVNMLLTIGMNAGWAADAPREISVADDLDAYYLPTFIGCAMFAGVGAVRVLRWSHFNPSRERVWHVAAATLMVLTVVPSLLANRRVVDRQGDAVAWHYVTDVLRSVAHGGVLLTRDWHLSSPLMYAQHVEQRRADVIVINLNLLERSWYVAELTRRHPEVWVAAPSELAVFQERVVAWEANPRALYRDDARRRALAAAFDDLVIATAASQLKAGRIYLTPEVALGLDGKGGNLAAQLRSRYQLVPQGLVFELRRERSFVEPVSITSDAGALTQLRRRLGEQHVASRRIASYSDSLANQGLYFENHGRCDRATTLFRAALAIEPAHASARAGVARCRER